MTANTSNTGSDGDVPILNLADVLSSSRANGPGVRDVFWVQGCSIDCPGCQNQELLPHERRHLAPVAGLLDQLDGRTDRIDGITISGGEPFEQPRGVGALLEGAHNLGLTTVVYTGHRYETLADIGDANVARALSHCDLLIDGPYVASERTTNTPWRGSANQRLVRLSERISAEELRADAPIEEFHLKTDDDWIEVFQTGIKRHDV